MIAHIVASIKPGPKSGSSRHPQRPIDATREWTLNEAGLIMATFLASAQFGRCSIELVQTSFPLMGGD